MQENGNYFEHRRFPISKVWQEKPRLFLRCIYQCFLENFLQQNLDDVLDNMGTYLGHTGVPF